MLTGFIYWLSEGFYSLINFPDVKDVLLLALVFFIPFKLFIHRRNYNLILKNRLFLFFLYCFLVSAIQANINFSQPLIFGIRASRIFFIYAVVFIYLSISLTHISYKSIYRFVVFTSIFLIFINFFEFYYNTQLYLQNKVINRFDDVRFLIGGTSIIYFYLFLLANAGRGKFPIIGLIGLMIVLVIISKTRSLVFPLLLITTFSLLKINSVKKFLQVLMILFLLLATFIFNNKVGNNIADLLLLFIDEFKSNEGNVAIRLVGLGYYWEKFDFFSLIFGIGMDNEIYIDLYNPLYFLSDLGAFRVLYYHGIIGIVLFALTLYDLYRESSKGELPLHKFGRYFVYFQFLSPTLTFVYHPTAMYIYIFTLLYIKFHNKKTICQIGY
jgi:hypothetical protein